LIKKINQIFALTYFLSYRTILRMKIKCAYTKLVPLAELKQHSKNRNTHPEKQIKALAKIIAKIGMRSPIVVSNLSGCIVKGHGRLEALKMLGWESAPVDYQDYESELEEFNDRVADNEIARYAEFDKAGFLNDIEGIPDIDFEEFGLLDFELPEIEVLPQCDEDEVPELRPDPITKRGDIWIMGEHRVICGDSTMIDDVEKLMNGKKAGMVFTSPPYNGDTHLDYGKGDNKKLYENEFDSKTSEEYIKFCHDVLTLCFSFCEGFIFWNVNYNAKSRFEYIKSILPFVENLHETIVWKKQGMPIPSGLTRNFEFIFCFKNGDRKHLSIKNKTEFNLWDISNLGSQDKENHRACFPVALPEKGILIGSDENQIILDPFTGSGTTLIACEKNKRVFYGVELDENYCDVIVKRWQKFTGKKAILESTKEEFDSMSARK
jgi:DNA modification methylase